MAVQDMLIICIDQACKKSDSFKIPLPSAELAVVTDLVTRVKALKPAAQQSPREEPPQKKGLLDRAKGAMKEVELKTAMGGGTNQMVEAMVQLATKLDGTIKGLDLSFAYCGSEVCHAKEAEMKEALYGLVKALALDAVCFDLVRGAAPYGHAEYRACQEDAVTAFFLAEVQNTALDKKLAETLQDASRSCQAAKNWDSMVTGFKTLNGKVAKISPALQKPDIKFDIVAHISEHTIRQFGLAMAAEEKFQRDVERRSKSIRALPTHAHNFDACFNGRPAFEGFTVERHYNNKGSCRPDEATE